MLKEKTKIQFKVVRTRMTDDGYGNRRQHTDTYYTFADSEKKAISNIRYRLRGERPRESIYTKGAVVDSFTAIPA